jgi:DNA-binding transcriptional LysR family regulator
VELPWEDAQTFLAVCEAESFSAAARRLDVGQPTVSRRIAGLEARLGTGLFVRGRSGAVPTPEALRLLPAAREMARWAGELGQLAERADAPVAGVVRIAAPPGVAVEQLAPFAARLRTALPSVRLEVLAGVEHIELMRGGADLAIRTRAPAEPELVSLARIRTPLAVRAHRSYAERHPGPCDWAGLDWITWTGALRDVAPRPMLERVIPGFAPVFAADDYLVQKAALRQGLGAMILGAPDADVAEDRELVTIPMGVTLPDAEFHLVCSRGARHVPRVRAVADRLQAELGRHATG